MLGFHEKRKLARIFYSKGTALVLFAILGGAVYAAINAYYVEQRAVQKRVELEKELQLLQVRAEGLEQDIVRLEDPRGIEAELRRRYDVAKEGEEVIVLIEEEIEPEQVPSGEAQPTSIFGRLRAFLHVE